MTGTNDVTSIAAERAAVDPHDAQRPDRTLRRNKSDPLVIPPSISADHITRQLRGRLPALPLGPEFDGGVLYEGGSDNHNTNQACAANPLALDASISLSNDFDELLHLAEKEPLARVEVWRNAYHEAMRTGDNLKNRLLDLSVAIGHIPSEASNGLEAREMKDIFEHTSRVGVSCSEFQSRISERAA